MSLDELEITGTETDCSYLPGRQSRMEYRVALALPNDRYETLLERGWRRFGRTLFRPVCRSCSECRSLRVSIPEFHPSKSQRRARNRNRDLEVHVQRPSLTDEHLRLYNAYHQDMHERRQWQYREITPEQYYESFLDGDFPFAREFQYRHHDRLVGLGLVDMTDRVMSSIYFIHAPDFRSRAMGTMSVVCELETGQRTGRDWLYMGYYIEGCGSMNYKNRFAPHEFLQAYVADHEPPEWLAPDDLP